MFGNLKSNTLYFDMNSNEDYFLQEYYLEDLDKIYKNRASEKVAKVSCK